MIALLALLGLAISLYFTLVAYRLIPPDAAWLPSFCRMDERSCGSVVHTRYGHLFLVPNGVWGLLWYSTVLAGGAVGLSGALQSLLLVASVGSVLLAVYLIDALDRRLGVFCPLCYLSHGINALLFLFLLP